MALGRSCGDGLKPPKFKNKTKKKMGEREYGFIYTFRSLMDKRVVNKRTMGQMPAIQVFNVPNKLIGPSGTQKCSLVWSQPLG